MQTHHPPTQQRLLDGRGGLVAIFIFAAGVVLLLSVVQVPQVSVVLKLVSDEVVAVFDQSWEVTDFPVGELRLTNLSELQLMGSIEPKPRMPATTPVDLMLKPRPNVSNWSVLLSGEGLRLNVKIPAQTSTGISFRKSGAARLQFTTECKETCGGLDTAEKITWSCTACVADDRHAHAAVDAENSLTDLRLSRREIQLIGGNLPVVINARFKPDQDDTSELVGGTRLGVREIEFLRKSEAGLKSSISGQGSIAFTSLEAEPLPISAGDFVYLVPKTTLAVRRISLADGVQIELEGVVKDLRSGPGGLVRSRRPSILAFLYSSKQMQLLLGAVLALAGAVTGALHRFGYLSKQANREEK